MNSELHRKSLVSPKAYVTILTADAPACLLHHITGWIHLAELLPHTNSTKIVNVSNCTYWIRDSGQRLPSKPEMAGYVISAHVHVYNVVTMALVLPQARAAQGLSPVKFESNYMRWLKLTWAVQSWARAQVGAWAPSHFCRLATRVLRVAHPAYSG